MVNKRLCAIQINCLNTINFTTITQQAHRRHRRVLEGPDVGGLRSCEVEETMFPEETTDLGRVATTMPHADAGNRTRATAWQQ